MPKDAVAAFNHGPDEVRFLAPVKAGARQRTHITLAEVKDRAGGRKLIFRCVCWRTSSLGLMMPQFRWSNVNLRRPASRHKLGCGRRAFVDAPSAGAGDR